MPHAIRLREKDINKLATVLQYPAEMLQELAAKNLLDDTEVRNLLILSDWRQLKKSKKYTTAQIVEALINEYQVSKSKVEFIIYAKKKSQYWCKECEKRIPRSEYQRNGGICDRCVALSIKL
jgi:formylmethanofuran dehydrogenase subunit E